MEEQAKKTKLSEVLSESIAEIRLLKKRLVEVEMERDILKKLWAFSAEIGNRKV